MVDYDSKWSTKFHKDYMLEFLVISLLRRLMIYILNFLNGIRAHVRYRAFATPQIELYHVVPYDSKCSTKFHKDCMFENFVISLLIRLMIIYIFFKGIRAHVQHSAFATLQIELCRVVDHDSKWSTKFHKDCMLENFHISLLRRLMLIFLILSMVLGLMFDTELLQHSKLNCTV